MWFTSLTLRAFLAASWWGTQFLAFDASLAGIDTRASCCVLDEVLVNFPSLRPSDGTLQPAMEPCPLAKSPTSADTVFLACCVVCKDANQAHARDTADGFWILFRM